MPTYTYQCVTCEKTQDEFHAISAKPRVKCSSCGGRCKRLMGTGSGIIFKGSGFYETDYKNKGKSKSDTGSSSGESAPSKSDSSSDSSSKKESKPSKKESTPAA